MIFSEPYQPVKEQRKEQRFQSIGVILRLTQGIGDECGQMQQEGAFAVPYLQRFFGENGAAAPGEAEMGDQCLTQQQCGETDGIGGIAAEQRLQLFVVQILRGAELFQRAAALQRAPLPLSQRGCVVPGGEESGKAFAADSVVMGIGWQWGIVAGDS